MRHFKPVKSDLQGFQYVVFMAQYAPLRAFCATVPLVIGLQGEQASQLSGRLAIRILLTHQITIR